MSKYTPNRQVCEAIYADIPGNNPLLAAMPDMLSPSQFKKAISNMPGLPRNLPYMSPEERQQSLALLSSVFVPMDYMYTLYSQLYRAIRETYTTRTIIDENRRTNDIFCNQTRPATQTAVSGSVLGVPGIGKTSAICRALATMPQVLEHTQYLAAPFFCKQVLYLKIECPSDCSVKALGLNLVAALDHAIGSDYYHQLQSTRYRASSSIATQIKILCITFHVGLLLIDEIQNAVVTEKKNLQVKPLLKFLVELTNDTATAVFFIGTPAVEELFISQEHLKRTRDIRLLPLKPDGSYREFLQQIWTYQFTVETAPLTKKIANKLFDFSGGIPAYIVKIFKESQSLALLYGRKRIDEKIMRQTIDMLAIKIPRTYDGGTYISEFRIEARGEDICSGQVSESIDTFVPAKQIKPMVPTELSEIAEPSETAGLSKLEKQIKTTRISKSRKSVCLSGHVKASEKKTPEIHEEKELTDPVKHAEPTQPAKTEETPILRELTEYSDGAAPAPRLYANQCGCKSNKRDDLDMTIAFQLGHDMVEFLREHDLLKEW